MTWRVVIVPQAQKAYRRLSSAAQSRITLHLRQLAENPRSAGIKKLRDRPGFRLRIGDYRVLYAIDDGIHVVEVRKVGHRKDIYD